MWNNTDNENFSSNQKIIFFKFADLFTIIFFIKTSIYAHFSAVLKK